MAKMLGCLVASMTIGAAVLDWFQPNSPDTDVPRRQLIAQIRDAIHPSAEGSTPTEKWQTIRALPLGGGDLSRAHFIIENDGKWLPTSHWQNQKTIGEAGVIKIGLRTQAESGEMTGVQWTATCHLRNNLQEMYKITNERFILHKSLRLADTKDKSQAR